MHERVIEPPASQRVGVIAGIGLRRLVTQVIERAGHDAVAYDSIVKLLEGGVAPSVVCVDLAAVLGEVPGALERLCARDAHAPVVAIAAARRPDIGAEAVRVGAYELVERPIDSERLHLSVRRAIERHVLGDTARRLAIALDDARGQLSRGEVDGRDRRPPDASAWPPGPGAGDAAAVVPLRELERREIAKALAGTGGNVAVAARQLGIGRATLYRRLAALDPPPPTSRARRTVNVPSRRNEDP